MAKYQYRVQGIDYNVDIVSVEDNIAKVSVNGIDFEVEMMKPAKTVKKTVVVAVPKPTGPALTDVVTDMKRDTGVRTASPASGTPVLAPLPGRSVLSMSNWDSMSSRVRPLLFYITVR